ncbi:FtsX-like permease family protein [Colwellia psychrerythraea]|uniref:Putative permease n=1 Tax=Colwellia psychrerythraea (strain 34H / ATCC BAA-681) TaxID=167879 RepID=Q488I9_COLP3|nr:FtsX-like permease family protein [Colwellia psychrerythraea]AAZ26733.1 putative permease [Colwellia psychrerythraea 34H]
MSMLIDIKYAFRLLFKAPKFTAMTLGVLIGGLSISLFTFSFLYTMVYKPLPIPEAETAKAITVEFDGNYNLITGYEYNNVKESVTSFAEFGVYDNRNIRLSVEQSGKDISGSYVQNGFFEFSRTEPILGRTIQTQDNKIGASPVALISYEIWQSELNGDEGVLSKSLMLNGVITDVIGVMPKGYLFPNTSQIWLPLSDSVFNATAEQSENYFAYGRVNAGTTIEQAELELGQAINQVYQQNVALYNMPEFEKGAKLMSFQAAQTNGQGSIVFVFLNAISWLILLLACINVGNLLLARTIERQKETAIRAALGATSSRLVSQLMWEGVIISTVGGILSLLLVGAALDYTEIAFHSWIPGGGSFWWHWSMDLQTLLMGIAFTVVTILLSAFLPAWRSANQDINTTLRDGTRGAQSKKAGRISRILVTSQVFLVATLMLIGSVSAYISHKLINLEMGDDYSYVMSARMSIPENKYPEPMQQLALFQSLKENIEQHPQVVGVVANDWRRQSTVTLEGKDYASEESKPKIDTITVIGDTKTVGIDLVAGRQFTHLDKLGHRKTAMISQSMAKRYWPGESALEKSFQVKIDDKNEKVFIVGVVTDRLNASTMFARLDSADEVYVSGLQFINSFQIVYYRTLPNTQNAEEIFYQAMFDTDRSIEMTYSVQLASKNRNMMRDSMGLMSNVTFGTGFFALLLAMVGIYGLTANSVAQRTHEVGIRRAVGASDKNITQMFLKQGARQLVIGLGLAVVLFALISFGFHKFTEEIFPVYLYFGIAITVVSVLSVIVMLAIFAPTKRAVKMEPSIALRYE